MITAESLESLGDEMICFAGNASYGIGGQGEFLRQMVFSLDLLPKARVYSRHSKANHAECVNLPFVGLSQRAQFDLLRRTPWLRRRRGWLALLSDINFDKLVAAQANGAALFDGVTGQCYFTFLQLKQRNSRLLLTCLNTHIDNLIETLEEEHRRIGFNGFHSFHPRMRERVRREIELSDLIRVNSEWAKRTFVERGIADRKIHIIRPAVNFDHFHPSHKRDDVFRVLAVATIEPRKGIHYLLQAFEEAKIPNSELVIIGATGDRWSSYLLRDFLRRNNNIRTCAMDIMSTPVAESFGAASVIVHPALEDGYGLVVPQALASGRPVIATRQAGASELIKDGENGFVVESRSAKDLKDYLRLLAADRNLLEKMSQKAPITVAHLSYQNFAREVWGFYRMALANGRT